MRKEGRSRYSRWLFIAVCIISVSVLAGCLKIKGPLNNGKAGGYYKTRIAVQGGTGKYLFTLESGALPYGLSLAQNGTITGTIDSGATGVFTFKVKAVDTILPQGLYKGEQELSIQVDNTPYKWTLITHFAVDNNINYEMGPILDLYLETLEDIKARDLGNNIQIILMMDAYNEKTKYADGYYYLTGGGFNEDLMVPIDEINSGSLSDTEAFLSWAAARYPSEHYMYSIFNHGSGFDDPPPDTLGVLGIGFDETNGYDRLTHHELGQATAYLKQLIGHSIDIFYPFACLMGGVELAYEVRNNVDYLLSSEENFPADIFSYQGIDAVLNDPDITTESLAIGMCDNAYQLLADRILNPRAFTLALVDLSKIDTLYGAIDTFALAALSDINNDQSVAAHYNQAADNSFTIQENSNVDDFYYVDLGDYLNHVIISEGIGTAVKTQAETVLAALGDAVLYQRQNKCPEASGLSIFNDIWGSGNLYSPVYYRQVVLFGTNAWTDFVDMVINLAP
jgi:hypothetical protein